MKKIVTFTLLLATGVAIAADISVNERKRRGTYNAVAHQKVVFQCIDQEGHPLSDVMVWSGVSLDGNPETFMPISGKTDTNGCFVVEGKSYGEVGYVCAKKGFYETRETKWLQQNPIVTVSHGRWQPYGMTNTVILKRKGNPVAMYVAGLRKKHTLIREVGEPMGFDLTVGDWVSPRGRGKTPDFHVTYIRDGSGRDYTALELILSAEEPFAGFIKVPCDTFSQFKSPYSADTNAVYAKEMRFSFRRNEKGRYEDGQLQADECLILRTRTRLDKEGRLVGAYYGKIYGPLRFGFSFDAPGEMKILHYLNPNENDPNLEADTSRNLLNPKDLGFAP